VSSLSGYLCTYSDPLAATLASSCRDADLGKGGLQPGPRLHGAGGEQRRSLQPEKRASMRPAGFRPELKASRLVHVVAQSMFVCIGGRAVIL